MSDTVKVGDVIALPVRINEPTFIDDAGDSPLAKVRRDDQAAAIALAINNHDRLQEENGRLREFVAKVRDRQFYGDSRFNNDAEGSLDHASFEARRILSEQPKENANG